MYIPEDGKEQRTPWFHSRERASEALELMKARHGGRAILYID
jgi:hypothetical protein